MILVTMYNLFIREFRKQGKRIFLTLVALIWGTMSIMLLLAFGEGLHRQLSINKAGMGDDIGILWGGSTSVPFHGLGKGRPIHLYKEDPDYLAAQIPEIKRIGGEYHRWGIRVVYGDEVGSEHITGITPDWEFMRAHIPDMGGRMIDWLDIEHKRRVLFIGFDIRDKYFAPDENPVGKTMTLNGIPFTVVGVMKEKMQMSSYTGHDRNHIAIPNTTFKAIYGDPYLDNIVYQPHEASQMPYIEEKIHEAMGSRYRFDPKDDEALSIWDYVESSKQMNDMLFGIKVFLGIIGCLTLIIAGVGVANIMYVSIKERTREIGIKLAVGARKMLILVQFLTEAVAITFIGGFLGMMVSIALTEGFKNYPIQSDVLDFMGRPTVSVDIGIVVVLILAFIGVAAGFFPALKAASVKPVESLRYE